MTLKIEIVALGHERRLRLIGRIDATLLAELRAQLQRHSPQVLDLDEVTLVDVAVVRFFNECEAAGIQLIHRAPYIADWMRSERDPAQ